MDSPKQFVIAGHCCIKIFSTLKNKIRTLANKDYRVPVGQPGVARDFFCQLSLCLFLPLSLSLSVSVSISLSLSLSLLLYLFLSVSLSKYLFPIASCNSFNVKRLFFHILIWQPCFIWQRCLWRHKIVWGQSSFII